MMQSMIRYFKSWNSWMLLWLVQQVLTLAFICIRVSFSPNDPFMTLLIMGCVMFLAPLFALILLVKGIFFQPKGKRMVPILLAIATALTSTMMYSDIWINISQYISWLGSFGSAISSVSLSITMPLFLPHPINGIILIAYSIRMYQNSKADVVVAT